MPWLCTIGCGCTDRRLNILKTSRATVSHSGEFTTTFAARHVEVEHSSVPRRGGSKVKDRSIRRQRHPRVTLSDVAGFDSGDSEKGRDWEPLFRVAYVTFIKQFRLAATAAGIRNAVPYQSCHSGATRDRALNLRLLDEVRQRGRRQCVKSLVRYEKSGRLNKAYEQLPAPTRSHLELCANQLEGIVLGRVPCPAALKVRRPNGYVAIHFAGEGSIANARQRGGFDSRELCSELYPDGTEGSLR